MSISMLVSNIFSRISQSSIVRGTHFFSTITIYGSGIMGSGIAAVCAINSHAVRVVDTNNDLLRNSKRSIKATVQRISAKKFPQDDHAAIEFTEKIMNNIEYLIDPIVAAKDTDLIIEAIGENLNDKQDLLSKVEGFAPSTCIFASNTSSLPIKDIAQSVSRKENLGGLHFFNPVAMMRLVEVVRSEYTSESSVQYLNEFAKSLGKTVVMCKDTPGFIVNRLLVPYMAEAIRMMERGDASIEDIDTAMRLGAGYPMGPFELSDYVGLDTMDFILSGWAKSVPEEPTFRTCVTLKRLVAEGRLGKKSGHGFYRYDQKGRIVSNF